MGVLDVLRNSAIVGGAAYGGYAQDEKVNEARLLAAVKAQRDAENDAVLRRVRLAGIDPTSRAAIAGAEANARVPAAVSEAKQLSPITTQTAVNTAKAVSPITTETAVNTAKAVAPVTVDTHAQERRFDNANPAPVQPSYSFQTITAPDGSQHVAAGNTKTGAITDTGFGAKAGAGSIPAGIRTKVAENESTLSTISEALKSLDAHPDAVGLDKNLPLVGKYVDQRLDPEGVATRALIANVGSLQIHTRTGANMNIREEPRLAPFVPDASDTPEAIKTKLTQLAQFLNVETDALVSGPATTRTPAAAAPKATPAAAAGGSRAQQLWDAAVAKYGEPKVLQEYGPRPPA